MYPLYLRPIGDETRYSDYASYGESPPFEAPQGFEWMTGRPPENAVPYQHPTLSGQLDALFQELPAETRAQFYALKAAMKLALDTNDIEAAKCIIQITTVPAELETAKAQMLAVFS